MQLEEEDAGVRKTSLGDRGQSHGWKCEGQVHGNGSDAVVVGVGGRGIQGAKWICKPPMAPKVEQQAYGLMMSMCLIYILFNMAMIWEKTQGCVLKLQSCAC